MGIKSTVYFEDPFWVGGFERETDRELETAREKLKAEKPKGSRAESRWKGSLNEGQKSKKQARKVTEVNR